MDAVLTRLEGYLRRVVWVYVERPVAFYSCVAGGAAVLGYLAFVRRRRSAPPLKALADVSPAEMLQAIGATVKRATASGFLLPLATSGAHVVEERGVPVSAWRRGVGWERARTARVRTAMELNGQPPILTAPAAAVCGDIAGHGRHRQEAGDVAAAAGEAQGCVCGCVWVGGQRTIVHAGCGCSSPERRRCSHASPARFFSPWPPSLLAALAPESIVARLSPAYSLVLNKFPVVDQHVLLVTSQFVPQAGPMSEEDLGALWQL
jgi:hypothetical protein